MPAPIPPIASETHAPSRHSRNGPATGSSSGAGGMLAVLSILMLSSVTHAKAPSDHVILWVPGETSTQEGDLGFLSQLQQSEHVSRVERYLATYEQLREEYCDVGSSRDQCLREWGQDEGARWVIHRAPSLLTAIEVDSGEVRHAHYTATTTREGMAVAEAWLLEGRVDPHLAVGAWSATQATTEVPPWWRKPARIVRRYVSSCGLSVIALFRGDNALVTDPLDIDVGARPRGMGGVVAVEHTLR